MPDIPSPKDALNAVNEFLALPGSAAQLSGEGAGGNLNPLNKPRKQRVKASKLYVMAGGSESDAKFMGEVAVGESHCNNKAVSWTGCCRCIWQIHEDHYAKLGYKDRETFNHAITSDPMECARAAVAVMKSQGRGAWQGTKYVGTGKDCTVVIDGNSINQNINAAAGNVAGAITDPMEAIAAVLKPIGDFFKIITSADTWIRVGKVLLGALLLLLAVELLTGGGLSKSGRAANRARNRASEKNESESE